ncbi:MAG: M14 family metallopeptidase [Halobacteria archaeon]|nr:M14 family metallopeptidase [Halobacteria archaeon]
MKIGSFEAERGEVTKGYIDLVSSPTGGTERAPVMVARGEQDGPVLWLTANVHGNEVTGIPLIHRIVTDELADSIRGAVVGVVSLNPSGLRRTRRESEYDSRDPNRLFPDFRYDREPGSTQEIINRRVFSEIADSADAVIDLHCSNVGSVPFTILPRVIAEESETDDAEEIADEMKEMADAFGFTPINSPDMETVWDECLHRSLGGSIVNSARIPSITVELGSDYIVESEVVDAAVKGVRNVMRRLGMFVDDEENQRTEPVDGIPAFDTDYPFRRCTVESPVSGILRKRVETGEFVEEGDPICEITDPFGETKHVVEADVEGWVTAFQLGLGVEEGSRICYYAGRADGDTIVETYEP